MAAKLSSEDTMRLQNARQAWLQNQPQVSLPIYQELAKRHANHVGITTELAQCYAALNQVEKADLVLDQVMQRHSSNGPVMAIVGRTYEQLRLSEKSLIAYEKSLKRSLEIGDEVRVRTSAAFLCERFNAIEKAQQHVTFLLKHAPNQPATLFAAGIIAARLEDWQNAELYLRQVCDVNLPPLLQARSRYELARVFDRQSRFGEAFAAVTNAKTIALPFHQSAKERSEWVADLTIRLTELIEPHHFSDWHREASSHQAETNDPTRACVKDPNICLVTGHPRSGTTLLEQILASHQSVSSADESSSLLHSLFSPLVGESLAAPDTGRLLLQSASQAQIDRGRAEYFHRLKTLISTTSLAGSTQCRTDDECWIIDKNPEAMVMLGVLQRSIPSARVLVVLRDPRDVCLSCFFQFLPATPTSINFNSLENTARKYARTMALWLKIKQMLKLRWCEVKYEELVEDPTGQSKLALDFLGLEFDESVIQFANQMNHKFVGSPTYRDVNKPIYQSAVERWRNYESHFGPAMEILQPFVDAFGYR